MRPDAQKLRSPAALGIGYEVQAMTPSSLKMSRRCEHRANVDDVQPGAQSDNIVAYMAVPTDQGRPAA